MIYSPVFPVKTQESLLLPSRSLPDSLDIRYPDTLRISSKGMVLKISNQAPGVAACSDIPSALALGCRVPYRAPMTSGKGTRLGMAGIRLHSLRLVRHLLYLVGNADGNLSFCTPTDSLIFPLRVQRTQAKGCISGARQNDTSSSGKNLQCQIVPAPSGSHHRGLDRRVRYP